MTTSSKQPLFVHQDIRVVAYRRVDCIQPRVCYRLALNNLFPQLQLYIYAFVIAMIISTFFYKCIILAQYHSSFDYH